MSSAHRVYDRNVAELTAAAAPLRALLAEVDEVIERYQQKKKHRRLQRLQGEGPPHDRIDPSIVDGEFYFNRVRTSPAGPLVA